jgi:two-component system, NarL family, response regulator DevR
MRAMLEGEPGMDVVGEANNAKEALAFAKQLQPDVIVLDVRLPDRQGIEICGELRSVSPRSRILICSGLSEGTALIEAARAGADGFVSKEAPNAEIIDAVRRVASGAAVVGADSAAAIFRHAQATSGERSRLASLTDREREILGQLTLGLTNREIAARLFVSEKTVRNHVSSLLHKLGLRHRTEAALFAAPLRSELGLPEES